jgi:hypothetical protein
MSSAIPVPQFAANAPLFYAPLLIAASLVFALSRKNHAFCKVKIIVGTVPTVLRSTRPDDGAIATP